MTKQVFSSMNSSIKMQFKQHKSSSRNTTNSSIKMEARSQQAFISDTTASQDVILHQHSHTNNFIKSRHNVPALHSDFPHHHSPTTLFQPRISTSFPFSCQSAQICSNTYPQLIHTYTTSHCNIFKSHINHNYQTLPRQYHVMYSPIYN